MDRGRHPQVIRTWKVERIRRPDKPPQAKKAAAPRSRDRAKGKNF